jgi:hypothetical protein
MGLLGPKKPECSVLDIVVELRSLKNSLFAAQKYFFDHSKVRDCGFAVLQCCGRAVSPIDILELHDRFALRVLEFFS